VAPHGDEYLTNVSSVQSGEWILFQTDAAASFLSQTRSAKGDMVLFSMPKFLALRLQSSMGKLDLNCLLLA
jgi:hypothetical protein